MLTFQGLSKHECNECKLQLPNNLQALLLLLLLLLRLHPDAAAAAAAAAGPCLLVSRHDLFQQGCLFNIESRELGSRGTGKLDHTRQGGVMASAAPVRHLLLLLLLWAGDDCLRWRLLLLLWLRMWRLIDLHSCCHAGTALLHDANTTRHTPYQLQVILAPTSSDFK
jgi:hypothetical protein